MKYLRRAVRESAESWSYRGERTMISTWLTDGAEGDTPG